MTGRKTDPGRRGGRAGRGFAFGPRGSVAGGGDDDEGGDVAGRVGHDQPQRAVLGGVFGGRGEGVGHPRLVLAGEGGAADPLDELAGPQSGRRTGDVVFVPGARCHRDAASLFGASASRLVVPGEKAVPVPADLDERATLLALAATAHHALAHPHAEPVELIVGHGTLGRLIARIATAWGGPAPVVWERDPTRRDGADGYAVRDPDEDRAGDYRGIVDASGDASVLDRVLPRLAKGSEIVLAGFYDRVAFAFPLAFMREARIRVSAEFTPADIEAVLALLADGALSLDGLITHAMPAAAAEAAYETAFGDPACLKMVLDWSAR